MIYCNHTLKNPNFVNCLLEYAELLAEYKQNYEEAEKLFQKACTCALSLKPGLWLLFYDWLLQSMPRAFTIMHSSNWNTNRTTTQLTSTFNWHSNTLRITLYFWKITRKQLLPFVLNFLAGFSSTFVMTPRNRMNYLLQQRKIATCIIVYHILHCRDDQCRLISL